MNHRWLKPILTLAVMGLLAWSSVDLHIQKIATMIFALTLIQVFGSTANQLLGTRAGAILTGFFGGLISSTATTASLARKSKLKNNADCSVEMVSFLSATTAMFIEAAALIWTGTSDFHISILVTLIGPLLTTSVMLYFYSRKLKGRFTETKEIQFQIYPILKLSVFIISIILISKILQRFFGQNGLLILTFLVSLFEIHGSIIANIQLHENGVLSIDLLSSLLAISITSSYLSKLFLISTLGSKLFRSHAVKCTLILFLSLSLSWLISVSLIPNSM